MRRLFALLFISCTGRLAEPYVMKPLLSRFPIFVLFVFGALTTRAAANDKPGDQKSLKYIEDKAPTIHAALVQNPQLRTDLGDKAYASALEQLAQLCRTHDSDCKDALQIIGDAAPRLRAQVNTLRIDGRGDEWRDAVPTPGGRRWRSPTEDRARDVWRNGVAAIVRDRRLNLLLGLEDTAYFDRPYNELRLRVDCAGGPEWDIRLSLSRRQDQWRGRCEFLSKDGSADRRPIDLSDIRFAARDVVEVSLDVTPFAPPKTAKPVWTMFLQVRTEENNKVYYPRTLSMPVINESAIPGVEAMPYVRSLMYLAADVGLGPDDRTACAIAIAAATIDATSDQQVRDRLRQDNARLLEFSRKVVEWQCGHHANYRLDQYPLEAQIAWANRCIWLGVRYLSWNHTRDAPGNMENYRWAYTDLDTLEALRALAIEQGLITHDATETARRIDGWVAGKLQRRPWIDHVEHDIIRAKDDPQRAGELRDLLQELRDMRDSGEITVGHFDGEPVYEIFARNTATYLRLIQKNGYFWGRCLDEAWIGQDMLRAAGIAPLALSVQPSRGEQTGHHWAGFFNPVTGKWHSAQLGRSGKTWWWLQIDRVAVFPSAAMANRAYDEGPLPFPLFFKEEIQGKRVGLMTQSGIASEQIRRWILTPSW
jgi:hypothetical protein